MSSVQSMKSSLEPRVRQDRAERNRTNLGPPSLCGAGWTDLQNDVYGRPVTQNTLNLGIPECNLYANHPQSVWNRLSVENNERPYIPIAVEGMRGAADLMGKGRDLIPQDLYGSGPRGNFVRHYPGNNAPPPQATPPAARYTMKRVQQLLPSHDATSPYFFRG